MTATAGKAGGVGLRVTGTRVVLTGAVREGVRAVRSGPYAPVAAARPYVAGRPYGVPPSVSAAAPARPLPERPQGPRLRPWPPDGRGRGHRHGRLPPLVHRPQIFSTDVRQVRRDSHVRQP